MKTSPPLSLYLSSNNITINFSESHDCEKMCLVVAQKSPANADIPEKWAGKVNILVCTDESQRLQGKFTAAKSKMHKSTEGGYFDSVKASNSTFYEERSETYGNPHLLEEHATLREALEFSLDHNNLLIDLQFDEVSVLLPSKHTYEIIYNRLGNDMLLWMPSVFSSKNTFTTRQFQILSQIQTRFFSMRIGYKEKLRRRQSRRRDD